MRPIHAAIATLATVLALASPAAAQQAAEPKVNMVIVYGDDKCPESNPDEIVVCPRLDESERYRIPPALRVSQSPADQSWTQRVRSLEVVGQTGTMSCSPVGAGGWTGCTGKLINQAYEERKSDPSLGVGKMIAAEREKRLSTIDAEAARTQADVEEEEARVEARRKLEAQANGTATQGEPATATPQPPLPVPPKRN